MTFLLSSHYLQPCFFLSSFHYHIFLFYCILPAHCWYNDCLLWKGLLAILYLEWVNIKLMFHGSFFPPLAMSLHCHVCFLNICFIHMVAFPETFLEKLVLSILSPAVLSFKCEYLPFLYLSGKCLVSWDTLFLICAVCVQAGRLIH